MTEPYVFPGLAPYAERAADAAKIDDPADRARVGSGPHADVVASALSQVTDAARRRDRGLLPSAAVDDQIGRARSALRALDAQREALSAALADAERAIKSGAYVVPEPEPRRVVERRAVPPKPSLPIARPTPVAPDAGASPLPKPDEPERSRNMADKKDKPKPPPVDETGRILDDIDGDGDVEPVVYPGVGEPTGPPAKAQELDKPPADEPRPSKSDKPKSK